jgi:formate dehydrogenase iron-sulfur subunit
MKTTPTLDSDAGPTLIDRLLREQSDLSAVERFAQFHEDAAGPFHEGRYRALLPATPPGPGQQYSFEVDLDRCSGCKACVTACHALNGLDDGEAWRDVGLLLGGGPGLPVIQHVTTACHHCLDPACLAACPVDAYEKDPITGIVRHLDDQCFGCKYCTLACPYDVPKYHAAKGIVRKCDLCGDRLGAGEAPACVAACPHEAIRVRVVDVAEVEADAEAGRFLPGAFDPAYTRPTTRFRSSRSARGLRAADESGAVPEETHWPLVLTLVLTQWAAGVFVVEAAMQVSGLRTPGGLAVVGLIALHAGLAASLAHLGRPRYAFRALIGLRHSWLSREVLAFGVCAALATSSVVLGWLGRASTTLAVATAAAGLAGLACSALIYHVVRRPSWHLLRSGPRFLGTAAVLGAATWATVEAWRGAIGPAAPAVPLLALAKWMIEARASRHLEDEGASPLRRSAALLAGPLAGAWRVRTVLALIGGAASAATLAKADWAAGSATLALLALVAGELVERSLFFAACPKPRMPGVPTP